MQDGKVRVSVVGGSGYAAGELLRLLLFHPKIELNQVISKGYAGQPVSSVHPNLRKVTDKQFTGWDSIGYTDLFFLCLPNGLSQEYIDLFLSKSDRVIDLGADFRLSNIEDYSHWYRWEHKKPELVGKFAYGIPEINREQIKSSSLIACAGCESTVSILTLNPLFRENLIDLTHPVIIDAKMSSSQSGREPSPSSHHPERAGAVRTYKPTGHRHTAEINEWMHRALDNRLRDKHPILPISITATTIEMVRGLLVTCHIQLKEKLKNSDILKTYTKYYSKEQFMRVLFQKSGNYRMPEPKILTGTNYCDIGFEVDQESNRLVVIGAIDNLGKGTSAQAVHAMNVMYGFDEDTGLQFPGIHPI
jgi:N-acetyl-gamma-glutamyl-phosphate/LysW-gamma-L-alpha-aminoadipyl-6-phosphate reductase